VHDESIEQARAQGLFMTSQTILFAWRRLTPPGFIGGAEITEGLWAALFASLGYRVLFIGSADSPRDQSTSERDWLERLLKDGGINFAKKGSQFVYTWRGVECFCVSQAELMDQARLALAKRPALLWTSQEGCPEIAALSRPTDTPVATYMHSVSEVGMLSTRLGARFVFVPSVFVQEAAFSEMGTTTFLLRPTIETATQSSRRSRDIVLFVNPIPEKGLEIALLLAKTFPDRKFVFVESWGRSFLSKNQLLPNVRLLPRQPSLERLYGRARLLIVPSVIPDAAPRVISEAGLRGIPVVGSTSGGIPELVADPTTNCIAVEDVHMWVNRVRKLLYGEKIWTHASTAQSCFTRKVLDNPSEAIARTGILETIR
jgi:hypothetical protein